MSRISARVATVAIVTLLAACSSEVKFPTAVAKAVLANPTAVTGDVIHLDASGSTDPQGRNLAYEWTFTQLPAGSAAKLESADQQIASFRADMAGSYIVQLVVSNGVLKSDPVTVTISATK